MITAGGGKGSVPPEEGVTTLRPEDAEAIRGQVQGVDVVAPLTIKRSLSAKGDSNQVQTMAIAVGPDWHEAWEWYTRATALPGRTGVRRAVAPSRSRPAG